jgi:DNA polymerase-4
MDAFYASIEQRDRPELRGLPVIVGGQQARGVVAAASYEARRFGVRSAMPGFEAKRLCPDGVFLSPNMDLYGAVSADVHRVFEQFTPEIEPLALDEAFLDITGSLGLFGGDAESLARALKERVHEATGLVVSVGVASNKLVAKIACRLGTIGDLARARVEHVARAAGERAQYFIELAQGLDERPIVAERAPKSIGEESTFERNVSDRETVAQAIVSHSEEVARRLRGAGYATSSVTLKMKLAHARAPRDGSSRVGMSREPDYPLLTRQRRLPTPTSDGQIIARLATELWDEAQLGQPVRLIGVSASALSSRAEEQLELFAPRRPQVGPTLDAIRERFGKQVIGRAVVAPEKVTPSLRRKTGD